MTKSTEERLAFTLERIEERLDRPAVVAAVAPISVMDRLWTAIPVLLLCATLVWNGSGGYVRENSDLKERIKILENNEGRNTAAQDRNDRTRERDIKLLDQYNRDLYQFVYQRGLRGAPSPPALGKE